MLQRLSRERVVARSWRTRDRLARGTRAFCARDAGGTRAGPAIYQNWATGGSSNRGCMRLVSICRQSAPSQSFCNCNMQQMTAIRSSSEYYRLLDAVLVDNLQRSSVRPIVRTFISYRATRTSSSNARSTISNWQIRLLSFHPPPNMAFCFQPSSTSPWLQCGFIAMALDTERGIVSLEVAGTPD